MPSVGGDRPVAAATSASESLAESGSVEIFPTRKHGHGGDRGRGCGRERMQRWRRRSELGAGSKWFALWAAALFCVGACQTVSVETSDGRPMSPPPRVPEATPMTAPVNRVALVFGPKPIDIDADGVSDIIELDAYLFSQPYPLPRYAEGTLVFEVFAPGAAAQGRNPLGRWEIGGGQLNASADRSVFGPCYRIKLDLREIGLAPFPLAKADLRCRFEPADGGAAVTSRGVERVVLRG